MIDAARNKVRVKACYVMMAVTIGACLVMVILGKRVSDNRLQLFIYGGEMIYINVNVFASGFLKHLTFL